MVINIGACGPVTVLLAAVTAWNGLPTVQGSSLAQADWCADYTDLHVGGLGGLTSTSQLRHQLDQLLLTLRESRFVADKTASSVAAQMNVYPDMLQALSDSTKAALKLPSGQRITGGTEGQLSLHVYTPMLLRVLRGQGARLASLVLRADVLGVRGDLPASGRLLLCVLQQLYGAASGGQTYISPAGGSRLAYQDAARMQSFVSRDQAAYSLALYTLASTYSEVVSATIDDVMYLRSVL